MKYWIPLFLLAIHCQANSVYIAQNAAGAANGSSAANALAVSYFNNGGNWSSGTPSGTQIGPGTIVHLVGTISTPLTVQGSGTSGNSITVLFEPNAVMSAANWSAAGAAITCSYHNYIVIDGGSNGVITATNQNSSSGIGSDGINFTSASNVEVRNLTLKNLYNKTSQADIANGAGIAIYFLYGSNILAHDNIISNEGVGISYSYLASSTSTNISIYRNTISGCNWGISSGSGGTNAVVNNFQIHDNDITMPGTIWDDPIDNNHHNGMYVWAAQPGSAITNLQIYNNYVHGDAGANATAFIYVSANETGSIAHGLEGVLIYNNLLVATAGGANDGCIFPSCNGFGVYNNTIVAVNVKGGLGIREYTGNTAGTSGAIQNNIIYNWGTTTYTPGGVTTLTYSNNLENINPQFVNGTTDFHLASSSPAANGGINLFSKFTTDKDGKARPQSGAWSIGAYVLGGSAAPVSTPTPTPKPTATPTPKPTATPKPTPTPTQTAFTIGTTTLLPLIDSGNGNLMVAQSATLSKTGTVRSMSFYVSQAAGSLRLGLYDAAGPGGGPGTKKAETNAITPVVGWNTVNIVTPVALPAGTYWLAYLPSSSSLHFLLDIRSGHMAYYSYPDGVMPATFSKSPASGISQWSFYATFN